MPPTTAGLESMNRPGSQWGGMFGGMGMPASQTGGALAGLSQLIGIHPQISPFINTQGGGGFGGFGGFGGYAPPPASSAQYGGLVGPSTLAPYNLGTSGRAPQPTQQPNLGIPGLNMGGTFEDEGTAGMPTQNGDGARMPPGMPTFGANLINQPMPAQQTGTQPGSFFQGFRSGLLGQGMNAMGVNPGFQMGAFNPQLSDVLGLGTLFMGPAGLPVGLANKIGGGLLNMYTGSMPTYGPPQYQTQAMGDYTGEMPTMVASNPFGDYSQPY